MPNLAKALRRNGTHPVMQQTDGQLFQAFCTGDQKAFEVLFRKHKAPLYAFCLRMVGEKERASDAFQDTFFRVIKYRNSYNPEKEFSSWLFAIARNACRTILNAEKVYSEIDDEEAESIPAPEPSLDFLERQSIADALQQLNPALREAIVLYEYDGFSYQEIAEITHASLDLVKVRIHRARKALRVMLRPIFGAQNNEK
jgi:RNA polymerase sigma-70 factor (ECF subfamily)